MANHRKFLVFLASVLAVVVIVVAVAFFSSAHVRQSAKIVELKATGGLPDVGWTDLLRMGRPGSHFNLPGLASDPNPYAAIRNPYSLSLDVSAGHDLFQSHCATCHGANAAGGPGGPTLQHRQMVLGSSDWALFRTISFGIRGTAMPANDLPWLDKWRLVAYIKSLTLRGGEAAIDSDADSHISGLKPVSYDDLLTAAQSPAQWLTYSGSYDGQRFSALNQITPANAGTLRLLWMRQYVEPDETIETTPLVVGDYMFVTIPPSHVEALNAKTGAVIWTYDRELPSNLVLCCGFANRGLAVLGETLFLGTPDAHLVALEIESGEVKWDVAIADPKGGYSITGAPLALKSIVVTGVAGGEFGARGFIDARDAATGREVWRVYSIPNSGQPGADSWKKSSFKLGGGPTWITGSFDPQTNTLYWPTGNPSPDFNGDDRTGDDLYTNSLLALDADSGALRWYFQFTPHDVFDWDATQIPVLFDLNAQGKHQHFVAQANRNAFYYLLNRDTGHFELAEPYAQQTWAQRIDTNGRPVVDPSAYPSERGTTVYPGVGGATTYQSPSYSPQSGYIYVPVLERGGIFYKGKIEHRAGEQFLGGSFEFFNAQPQGAVRALDPLTGEKIWEYRNPAFQVGGLVSTSGGVVFGSQQDSFFALDAKTGRELWHVSTSGRIAASPISFTCDGMQMITIAAGHDLLTFGL